MSMNENCLCVLVVTKTAKVSVSISGVGLGLDPAGLGLGLGLGLSGLGLVLVSDSLVLITSLLFMLRSVTVTVYSKRTNFIKSQRRDSTAGATCTYKLLAYIVTKNTEVFCTNATCAVTHSKCVVRPQKRRSPIQTKCQCEERLTDPYWKNAELGLVHTAFTYHSGKNKCQVLLL